MGLYSPWGPHPCLEEKYISASSFNVLQYSLLFYFDFLLTSDCCFNWREKSPNLLEVIQKIVEMIK